MDSTAVTHQEDNFLGLNFNSFLKQCGCAGPRDDDSVSDTTSQADHYKRALKKRAKKAAKKQRKEMLNQQHEQVIPKIEPSQQREEVPEWGGFEDLLNEKHHLEMSGHYQTGEYNQNNMYQEENFADDPIDFDYLKKITVGYQDEEEDHEAKSEMSVSQNSKKIQKKLKNESIKNQGNVTESRMSVADNRKSNARRQRNKRRPWQPHEDQKVLELVDKYGQSWAMISSLMNDRTGKQIRDRYLNKLKPDIKTENWTNQEDEELIKYYHKIGNKWSKIAVYLPGRTEGQVKNRYYSHIKKKLEDAGEKGGSEVQGESLQDDQSFAPRGDQSFVQDSPLHSHSHYSHHSDIKSENMSIHDESYMPLITHSAFIPDQEQNDELGGAYNQTNMKLNANPFYYSHSNNRNPFGAKPQQQDPTDLISYEHSKDKNDNTAEKKFGANTNPNNGTNDILSTLFKNDATSEKGTPKPTPQMEKDTDAFVENATNFLQQNGLNNLLFNPKQQIELAMGGFLGNQFQGNSGRNTPNGNTNEEINAQNKEMLSNMEKLERIEQLNKRKANLEYLLAKTLQQIQKFNYE